MRTNNGVGDLVATAEYRMGSSPQLTLESGVKFATGDVDKTDQFGQRICDILALGSGTSDFLLGAGLWWPHFLMENLDVTAQYQHRCSGGKNKWGYQFGNQSTFSVHGSRPIGEEWRFGVRAEGYHTEPDTWYGNKVPERGATILYLGPTAAIEMGESSIVGVSARFPVAMKLEGSQMVAPVVFGLEFNTDLSHYVRQLTHREEDNQ